VQSGRTANVIVVIIDGPRMSETWEHPTQKYIPYQRDFLSKMGVVNRQFYNLGNTFTIPGHIAITTGAYDNKQNNGRQYPTEPSMFQQFLECSDLPPSKACIVGSKKKLEILQDCESLTYRNAYLPSLDTENRSDMETFQSAIQILEHDAPKLMMIHFKGPDANGHDGDWNGYIKSIRETDSLLFEVVNYIESDPKYKDKTALLMTNDHGRHLDGIGGGFVSHGDHCRGCTHINFMAIGPDFKTGEKIHTPYELTDIAPTIGYLLGFSTSYSTGQVMYDLFKK